MQFHEFPKDEIKRLANTNVRVLLDPVVISLYVTDCNCRKMLATSSLLLYGFNGSLP